MILYTDRLIPKRFAGYTVLFVILIRPAYRCDRGLLEHERVHVRQFWRNPLHPLLYWLSPEHRLAAEVEAYKEQLRWCWSVEERAKTFAEFIATKYGLSISAAAAEDLLRG
jgi:hypothetical protein